jgi:hypothetical protein
VEDAARAAFASVSDSVCGFAATDPAWGAALSAAAPYAE